MSNLPYLFQRTYMNRHHHYLEQTIQALPSALESFRPSQAGETDFRKLFCPWQFPAFLLLTCVAILPGQTDYEMDECHS